MPTESTNRLSRPIIAASIVFLLALASVAGFIWHMERVHIEAQRARVAVDASGAARTIQSNLERAMSATYALAALVRQGDGVVANFEAVAQEMLPFYPGVAGLALAPRGIVQSIVPLAGNESSIGHDMLNDPARATESAQARDSGQLTLAGPFSLVQGGTEAVARLPVSLGKAGSPKQFWGFATVLLRFPEVLSEVQFLKLAELDMAYELWRVHPDTGERQVIAASSGAPLVNPYEVPLEVANASWTLSVAPVRGWGDPFALAMNVALGLLFSLMLAAMAKLSLEQRQQRQGLKALVARRTSEIKASRNQLRATIDAIPDNLWELGLDGRVHASHWRRTGLSDEPAASLAGKTVSESFGAEAAAVIMAALSEAHHSGSSVGKQFEQNLAHGTAWFELSVSRKRTDSRHEPRFIALARDISERKAAEAKVQRLTQLYVALSQCNQAIVRCATEEELFNEICRNAVQLGGMKMAYIGMLDAASMRIVPVASYGDDLGYLAGVQISVAPDSPYGQGASGTAFRTGQAVWFQDFGNDPRNAPWYEAGARAGWGGVGSLPLYRDGQAIGVFSIYVAETNAFDEAVRGLLVEMATDISYALDNFERESLRRQSQEALRESEERYRSVTQFAADAIIIADSKGNIAGWNRGAEVVFGYTEAEAIGQTVSILMPERYHEQHCQGMDRALSGGLPRLIGTTLESFGRRKDGSEFPLELSLAAWGVAEGRCFTGVVRDITRRKQNEAKLRLSANVFEQSNEGITITDVNRNIVLVNPAFTAITGYSEAEAIGQNPRMLSSGRQDKEFYRSMWESIDTLGYWQGEVWNRTKDGTVYPEWLSISRVLDSNGVLTNYIGIFSDMTRHKAAEEHILRLGHFDPLTGLANRILLNDRVKHAISMAQRSSAQLAVLFFDLDHFKHVNDSLGHGVGDKLLIDVAARLKSSVREQDTVARLGGDEFVLVLPDTNADGAAHVAEKLLETIPQSYWIDQYELAVTPSIGIAVFPGDGTDHDTLFKRADAAMYAAKKLGRNQFRFFTAEMQARSARTLQLETALRSALKRNQFELHFQPQVSLSEGHVIGAEALLRWEHPELGTILPAEFIPIAEDSGQILSIGEWVLRQAARQSKRWIDGGLAPMTIAVNLSAAQFRHPGLTELVMQILDEENLSPPCLEFELTESVAMDNPLGAIAVMDNLRQRGIRMAIDDFGTGYSSLSYLKRFQVYKLKIDRSFVRDITVDPEDKAIVGAIISLAKSLGLQTIAEGVETEGQLDYLRGEGCGEVQGFYFSKPLPADQFEAFVRERSAEVS
jgi:diguanylate cyclase (GGDEF)-like protein/PAS domain S-box-containing protein